MSVADWRHPISHSYPPKKEYAAPETPGQATLRAVLLRRVLLGAMSGLATD